MAALTGQTPAATYKDLLQVSNSNSGIDATMRAISDGEGTDSLLFISSAGVAVNTGLNIGAATAVTGGKVTQTAALSAATGDEIAYSLAYTTNKSGSGDDTGLQIVQTDTASPGTSYLINAKVATASKFSVDNTGSVVASAIKLDTNSVQYADVVTLTDNTLTDLFDVALADTAMAGGTFHYTIKCVDATPNYQVEHGTVNFMAFNKATAYTTDFNVTSSQILGSGTLTTTFSIATGTNLITMKVTSNSSLTPTAFTLTYHLILNHSGAVTKKT